MNKSSVDSSDSTCVHPCKGKQLVKVTDTVAGSFRPAGVRSVVSGGLDFELGVGKRGYRVAGLCQRENPFWLIAHPF